MSKKVIDRAAIRARVEDATPGPWEVDSDGWIEDPSGYVLCADYAPREDVPKVGYSRKADADYIVHAREDIPALLDLVDELEAEVARISQLPDMRVLEQAIAGRTVPTAARAVLALLPTPSAGANGAAS